MIDPDENETPDEGQLEVEVAPAEEGGAASPSEAKLRERLAAVEKDRQDTYERLLRTAADFDNFRKRARKDADEARLKAREELLKEILPGIDNLERALVAADASPADAVLSGVRLVLRQFQSALERVDVKAFDSVGQPFDPTRHEAISQVETDDQPPGTVVTEMQRGYNIGPRLLRPALVTVAKPKPAAAEAPGDTQGEKDEA
jgi:molecular chaperone GrpE